MTDEGENTISRSRPLYRKSDIITVMREIAVHMEVCTKAWIGLGEGRVLILKDDARGLSTYYTYEEEVFTFYDHRGGSQRVHIEEITEIGGF